MRVEFTTNGYEVSEVLRTYAESRVWLAVHRAADQLSWAGVRLIGEDGQNLRDRRCINGSGASRDHAPLPGTSD